MEHPSIMSFSRYRLNLGLRLITTALAVTIAGCGSDPSPYGSGTGTPVQRSGGAGGSYSSMERAETGQSTYEPNLILVEESPGTVPLAEGHPDRYTVQAGDTLWDIAATFLRDPWYWPEVWYVNPQIENPHLIFPGDVLSLVYIGGQPRVTTTMRGPTYRMSPAARETPLTEAVTAIPYEQVSAFLSKGLVLEKGQFERMPYIVAARGDHMIAAAGNSVYIRGGAPAQPGTRYSVVHVGDQLRDPDDNDVVGYQGIYVGEGMLARGGDPATVALTDTNREAIDGDRLLPESVDIPLNFYPKAPDMPIDGKIISVVDGVSMIGQYQVVVMNRGARNGLAPGDILTVFQAGEVVKDRIGGGKVKLPDEEAGTIMVFKVYDRIGYGLVMEATQPIHVLDAVRNPY
jgi:hypothetical protein